MASHDFEMIGAGVVRPSRVLRNFSVACLDGGGCSTSEFS